MGDCEEQRRRGIVLVHVGAGFHAKSKEKAYRSACKRACEEGARLFSSGASVVDVAEAVVACLEDCPETNAGRGSNLTFNGHVEADAAIMDGATGAFGAVGAVRGLSNPVRAARVVMEGDASGLGPLGLVRPLLVVGDSAARMARDAGLAVDLTGGGDSNVTESARSTHHMWRQRISAFEDGDAVRERKRRRVGDNSCGDGADVDAADPHLLATPLHSGDTVGAIVLDMGSAHVATAISSGGALLKPEGRVGDAAMYGCGCNARTVEPPLSSHSDGASASGDSGRALWGTKAAACCTTGTGEHLMRCNLASEVVSALLRGDGELSPAEAAMGVMDTQLLRVRLPGVAGDDARRLGGFIACVSTRDGADLLWSHSTPSMVLGYRVVGSPDSEDPKPTCKTVVSRLGDASRAGKAAVVAGAFVRSPDKRDVD